MMFKSLSLLAVLAKAQDFEASDEIALRKFSHINRMLMSQITTSFTSKDISKMIQNYGCHCFPGNTRAAGGKGPAQDEYDSLCAELSRCHKCIEFDHGNYFDGSWDADIGKYRFTVNGLGDINCDENGDQHKFDLCKCDAAYIFELMKRFSKAKKEFLTCSPYAIEMGKVWADSKFNRTMWSAKNNAQFDFDAASVCVRDGNAIADACCGEYPNRYPYDSAMKMCCEDSGRVYDDAMYDCCQDGSISMIGAC